MVFKKIITPSPLPTGEHRQNWCWDFRSEADTEEETPLTTIAGVYGEAPPLITEPSENGSFQCPVIRGPADAKCQRDQTLKATLGGLQLSPPD